MVFKTMKDGQMGSGKAETVTRPSLTSKTQLRGTENLRLVSADRHGAACCLRWRRASWCHSVQRLLLASNAQRAPHRATHAGQDFVGRHWLDRPSDACHGIFLGLWAKAG